jgi:protein dithiol oxidoreductase (disulfide-forming)
MNRREFVGSAAALVASAGAASIAHAQQSRFVEGQHYVRLSQPVAVSAGGKIEVVEFFWYGCPHCFAFEPALEAWIKKLPADVAFRRAPVGFSPRHQLHQRLYFALEAMGQLPTMHQRVFNAMHVERLPLDKPDAIADFMAKNGQDRAKFLEVLNSFSVQSKARQASQLTEGYKIDGVPALGINGRYYTSPSLAGGDGMAVGQLHALALSITDELIARARKAA